MPAPKYLKQRNGVWYVQLRVPANLKPQLGATLIRSLKTRDEAEANRKHHAVIADFQERISKAGLTPAGKRTIPIHYALRHTVITQMTEAGHPEWLREAIVGHEAGSVIGRHYVKSDRLDQMLQALQAVTHGEEVDAMVSSAV